MAKKTEAKQPEVQERVIFTNAADVPRWIPDNSGKKPAEFKFKSTSGIWFRTQDEYYQMLRLTK